MARSRNRPDHRQRVATRRTAFHLYDAAVHLAAVMVEAEDETRSAEQRAESADLRDEMLAIADEQLGANVRDAVCKLAQEFIDEHRTRAGQC
jgi:hypothetical protein